LNFSTVLDPGHGGIDPGGVGNIQGVKVLEKNLNYSLALAIRDRLVNYLIDVTVIQPSCLDPKSTGKNELYKPVAVANRLHKIKPVDLYLSLHTNAGKGTGTEIFCGYNCSELSLKYSGFLHDRIAPYVGSWGYVDRGKKQAKYYVLTYTKMPAVLIETLFIDTARDVKALVNADFMAGLASVIAAGICDCAGVKWNG